MKSKKILKVVSVLFAIVFVLTAFSGLFINASADEPPKLIAEAFDSYDTDKWQTGDGITEASINAGKQLISENNVLTLKATGGDNVLSNTLISKTDIAACNSVINLEFAPNLTGTGSGIGWENVYSFGAGIVARGTIDENGNLTEGYIVVVEDADNDQWNTKFKKITLYKVKNGVKEIVVGTDVDISSNNVTWNENGMNRLRLEIIDVDSGSDITLKWSLQKYQNDEWKDKYTNTYVDTTPLNGKKAGVAVTGTNTLKHPWVDVYNYEVSVTHKFTQYDSNNDATCKADGTKTGLCDYGCGTKDTVTDEGSKTDIHDFKNYVSNNDATCKTDGTKTGYCSICDKPDTIADIGSKLEHKFTDYKSDNNATKDADGTKTAVCDYGCGTKDKVADVGSKLKDTDTSVSSTTTDTEEIPMSPKTGSNSNLILAIILMVLSVPIITFCVKKAYSCN